MTLNLNKEVPVSLGGISYFWCTEFKQHHDFPPELWLIFFLCSENNVRSCKLLLLLILTASSVFSRFSVKMFIIFLVLKIISHVYYLPYEIRNSSKGIPMSPRSIPASPHIFWELCSIGYPLPYCPTPPAPQFLLPKLSTCF